MNKEIPISPELVAFEGAYRLPVLLGTPRQVAWARNIRHNFLSELLPQVMEVTAGLHEDDAHALYDCLDRIRNNRQSVDWIQKYKPSMGDAVTFLMDSPEREEREREEEEAKAKEEAERKVKAARQRALAIKAMKYEREHNLPPLQGTPKQVSFGRRCRYMFFKAGATHHSVSAHAWITIWMNHKDKAELEEYALSVE